MKKLFALSSVFVSYGKYYSLDDTKYFLAENMESVASKLLNRGLYLSEKNNYRYENYLNENKYTVHQLVEVEVTEL